MSQRTILRLPHSIALLCEGVDAPAASSNALVPTLSWLLEDLAEALAAYERASASAAPGLPARTIRIGRGGAEARGCDTAIVALSLDGHRPGSIIPAARAMLASAGIEPEAPLYLLLASSQRTVAPIDTNLQRKLATSVAGAIAIPQIDKLFAHRDAPRMGRLRHRASEAIDQLIAAIRSGGSPNEVAHGSARLLDGAPVLVVPPTPMLR